MNPCLPHAHTAATLRARWSSTPVQFDQQFIKDRSIPEPNSGCWLWALTCDDFGYGYVDRAVGSGFAHRIAWQCFRGTIPNGMVVRHRCDNPGCCNPEHLELGSHQDNSNDCRNRDRHTRGERSPAAKLTDAQASKIRELVIGGIPQRTIAEQFNIHHSTVGYICRGRTWKHLDDVLLAADRGGRSGRERLTQAQKIYAQEEVASGRSLRSVAAEMDVGHRTIGRVVAGGKS